jgi:CheY-like chemotaxis protein
MCRILVIDDDELLRATVQRMLKSGGHQVWLAKDGEDGIRQFQQRDFDLVLCDLLMPRKDGIETVRELRRITTNLPIITMTGDPGIALVDKPGKADYLEMTRLLGATRTIAKPFKALNLLRLVQECAEGAAPSAV